MKQKKPLARDEEKAVVAGVLAGLAEYFDQDPVLFRIIAVTFLVFTGFFPGVLLYLGAMIVVPKKQPPQADYEVVE